MPIQNKMQAYDKGLIYLYCVTDRIPKLKYVEALVNKSHFVYQEGLYAVVSSVSHLEFGEEGLNNNLADLEWVKIKAAIHEKVIETVMQDSSVIPFKFGTMFNTEENLKIMLKVHISKFKSILKYIEDKEEWGVKIYCDIDRLEEELIREDKALTDIDKEIESASVGKAFILRKKKKELVNTSVNKKLNCLAHESFERLKQYSVQSRVNRLLPKEVTERKEEMILNSVFLIYKDKRDAFRDALDVLIGSFKNKGLFFDCTGPWPPYNFCQPESNNG